MIRLCIFITTHLCICGSRLWLHGNKRLLTFCSPILAAPTLEINPPENGNSDRASHMHMIRDIVALMPKGASIITTTMASSKDGSTNHGGTPFLLKAYQQDLVDWCPEPLHWNPWERARILAFCLVFNHALSPHVFASSQMYIQQ